MRYFLHLAYQGTHYHGWQRQTTARSVQQVIEDSIAKMIKHKVFIHGCGRTDAGVHASQYFAHIDLPYSFDYDFVERINRILPSDISIYELIEVAPECHAQYDARQRTYTYYFHTKKIPAKSKISAYYPIGQLDLTKLYKALDILKTIQDFRSLCKNPDVYKHTICKISSLNLQPAEDGYSYALEIKADRFLRGMIRYIVARLLDVGSDKLDLELFATTLASGASFDFRFQKQGYPHGLFLTKVEYPYLSRSTF